MSATTETDPLIGAQVGSYRIEKLLGEGGMGRVYEALQPAIHARVAIKVIANRVVDDEDTSRFFAEARAVNLIRHERIVNIIDLTALPDGRPCIIMELIDGCTLEQALEHGEQLPIGTVLRLIGEVVSALGAAHEQDVIHRDLKPGNIFLTPGGHAKLVDFGIAKLLSEPSGHQTEQGVVVGTVPYMSPEQAAGGVLDGRSDLFSVGVVLFEALTGQRPFQSENIFAIVEEHAHGPPSSQVLRPDIPEVVDGLIRQALTVDPQARFASADAMLSAIDIASRSVPESEFRPIPVNEIAKFAEASRASAELATATAATAAAVPRAKVAASLAASSQSLALQPIKRSTRWPWFVAAVVFVGAGLAMLSLASEEETAKGAKTEPIAVDAAPPPEPAKVLRSETARPAGPIDLYAFVRYAKSLAREHIADGELASVTAHAVAVDGSVVGRATIVVTSPSAGARATAPCRVEVSAEGTRIAIEVGGESAQDCPAPVVEPKCPLDKLHGIFRAAAGDGGTLEAHYGSKGWRLSSDDGEMSLNDGLCANQ